ncbi:MAG: hypothetical protein ENTB_01816 [Enterocloster aldenensis]
MRLKKNSIYNDINSSIDEWRYCSFCCYISRYGFKESWKTL